MDLISTKPGSMPVSELPIPMVVPSISNLASLPFPKDFRSCLTGLRNTIVLTFVWSLPANIESLFLTSLRRITYLLLLLIQSTQNLKKEIRQTARMPSGSVTFTCVIWSNHPLYRLPTSGICEIWFDTASNSPA